MAPLIDNVRRAMRRGGGAFPVCMACGRRIGPRDDRLHVRGGAPVHRACATYELRRRRTGSDRLGYPRAR